MRFSVNPCGALPERLPAEWAVSGTTGYDFSNLVNGLFVDSAAATRFQRIYRNFTNEETSFDDLGYRCRKLIIHVALASELNVLANKIARIALAKRRTCDFTLNSLRDALTEVVANFPVYRTYISPTGVSETDTRYVRLAIASAKWRSPAADTSIFDFISNILLTNIAEGHDTAYRRAVISCTMKFQQFTSPVMAKGLEDTAFYRYNRLVSLNDVGGDLHRFGITTGEFHFANQERLRTWPHTMLATSTHDSKRSEDVRARINVLSEIPGLWRLRLRDWKRFNRRHKRLVNDRPAPSANDEYLLYQTLIGAWPLEPLTTENEWKIFRERIENYMLKAIREAKRSTSWINRNAEYEEAVSSFVSALLNPTAKSRFLEDFIPFQRRVARIGVWNSLAQTLLKLTCPGVPDIYQGNDLWDFSLVDPDNRRPVDYSRRQQLLDSMRVTAWDSPIRSLLGTPDDDRVKLFLTWKALQLRQECPDLFQQAEYLPLAVGGTKSSHVMAFIRNSPSASVVVVVPRLLAGLLGDGDGPPVGPAIWEDTYLELSPGSNARSFRNVLTGKVLEIGTKALIAEALVEFPVALYVSR